MEDRKPENQPLEADKKQTQSPFGKPDMPEEEKEKLTNNLAEIIRSWMKED